MFPLNLHLMDLVLVWLSLIPFTPNTSHGISDVELSWTALLNQFTYFGFIWLTDVCSPLRNKLPTALLNRLSYIGFINLIKIFSLLLNKLAATLHFSHLNHQIAILWVTSASISSSILIIDLWCVNWLFFLTVTLDCLNSLKVLRCVSTKVISWIHCSVPINLESIYFQDFLPYIIVCSNILGEMWGSLMLK